jgi:hypothetical protein
MDNTKLYDYCIIGAGPTGLTLAYLLSNVGKKCIIIDENLDIGGCHRVTRVNGFFTEHGPRIYSDSYINFIKLLKMMNVNFYDLFTPYKFTISNIGNYTLKNFNFCEKIVLFFHYLVLIFNSNYGENVSMKEFMNTYKFTDNTKDYIDRLCRLTDGTDSDKYSLNKFYQLINQQSMHKIYQPKQPNDKGLFKIWKDKLIKNKVDILLNTKVINLYGDLDNVKHIQILSNNTENNIYSNKFILCLPPKPLLNLLSNSIYKNSFGKYDKFNNWVIKSSYNNYLPVSFHWDKNLIDDDFKLNNIWGFPNSEWGIAFIVLSNYMNFNDSRSKLVISTCVTKTDTISSYINKTANQCNLNELKQEIFRQLKISFPNLPNPSNIGIGTNVKYLNNKWDESDTAFIKTFENQTLSAFSNVTNNLYQVGTQNGNSNYGFTTMESSITNAIVFANTIEPKTQTIITKTNLIELNDVIKIILFVIILLLFIKKFYKK